MHFVVIYVRRVIFLFHNVYFLLLCCILLGKQRKASLSLWIQNFHLESFWKKPFGYVLLKVAQLDGILKACTLQNKKKEQKLREIVKNIHFWRFSNFRGHFCPFPLWCNLIMRNFRLKPRPQLALQSLQGDQAVTTQSTAGTKSCLVIIISFICRWRSSSIIPIQMKRVIENGQILLHLQRQL